MKPPRWTAITESEFPWEREALDWLREQLPDTSPWHAWSNFEFIDDDGKVNEVDVLVLAPTALFLIEIKSRPGMLTGDARTWTWVADDHEYSYDNPLYLTNRKAKRLAALLRQQPSFIKAKERMPWVEPAIFLSATRLQCKLEGPAGAKTYQRGQPGTAGDPGILGALFSSPNAAPERTPQLVDHRQARAIVRAMAEAGIRASNKHRRVGDYQLEALLGDGVNYQDWTATHVSVGTRRRVRIYGYGKASSPESRTALARQARREFQILEGVESPGILRVQDYKESELGPALLFEYDANALRLDHYLQRKGTQLDIGRRLFILRELAETLAHAHKKRLYHRALSPASVLVRETSETNRPLRLQITNWQTASREGTDGGTAHTTGTRHVDEYVEDRARVYLAPEAIHALSPSGPLLDVFALGAIAYLVLSGKPPADDPAELAEKLRLGPGLRLSDTLDGAAESLQYLVQFATHSDVSARTASIEDFIKDLDDVEEELTAPEPERFVDPSVAKSGDRIAAGFTVVKRLGRGSSADVLLVRRDGGEEELVLKVAIDARHNDRLGAEGETLRKLRHQNIVELHEALEVAGRTALLMRRAGDRTLAQRLREEGRLSLDLLHRFGEELLESLDFMEQSGVTHRDIKPDNIGIAPIGEKGMLHLVLFDFSLARTPVDNLHAGTPGYLDPFLTLRKPARWDLYAERFAAAVTLYEMATGTLPAWGDGATAPDMLDCEVELQTDAFDPNLREGLAAFFDRALRRDFRQRFDNAEEMLRAWRRLFDEGRRATSRPEALEAIAMIARVDTTIGELGYGVDAQNVLERMGIHTLRELLAVDRVKFRYLSGVGDRVRKEIRLAAKRLAQLRPDLVPGRATVLPEGEAAERGPASIDELAAQLLPKRPAGDDRPDERAVALYLGIEPHESLGEWPVLGEVAREAGISRSRVGDALIRLRERWLKTPQLTLLRDDLVRLLESHGGVATVEELSRALLAERGSAEQEDALRLRLARAALRAAMEAEQQRETPRYQAYPGAPRPLVASHPALADYAERLGAEADRLSQQDPLLAPITALHELEAVPLPEGTLPLLPQRLLRIATAASRDAAISSRSEIYPVGMPALQALKQSLGALVGPRILTEKDLFDRVRGRYPACGPIPVRPELDQLLDEAGAALVWREAQGKDAAGYGSAHGLGPSVGSTTAIHRLPTDTVQPAEVTEAIAEARAFEEKLSYVLRQGGFLALTTQSRSARRVQAELEGRFGLISESLDDLLIEAMLEQAHALAIDWNVVLSADRSAPGSTDWRNLTRLASKAAEKLAPGLASRDQPLLLTEPGLVARYALMAVVRQLQDTAGRPGHTPAVLLLVPMAVVGPPAIDDAVVPVISSAQWARVPEAWIQNLHRSGASA